MTLHSSSEGVKRSYNSPRRQAQADETRTSILTAAKSLFEKQGFADSTIKQIAEAASVSEQTLYNTFGDKPGLLVELAHHLYETGNEGKDAEFFEELAAEPDPLRRIRLAASFSRQQWEEGAVELDRMLFGTTHNDPRLTDLAENVLSYKHEVNRTVCQVLFPDPVRRSDVTIDEIAAFATAVDSGATMATLHALGWSQDQYEDWVYRLLVGFLDPDYR